jgi:hypothetical protein
MSAVGRALLLPVGSGNGSGATAAAAGGAAAATGEKLPAYVRADTSSSTGSGGGSSSSGGSASSVEEVHRPNTLIRDSVDRSSRPYQLIDSIVVLSGRHLGRTAGRCATGWPPRIKLACVD